MSFGRGSCSLSSTTSSSRRQCGGGGRSGLFSNCDSFYQLCQLSALPASILGLSEQTKTGATRGRGRQRRLISGPCSYYWRRRIQYTSRLVFAFFWLNYRWCIFEYLKVVILTRDWFWAQSVGEYFRNLQRDAEITEGFCLLLEKGLARTIGAGPSNILAG